MSVVLGSDDLVSVVLPVFNREDVVGDSVRSVLDQTHDRLELIVVDDGSDDRSVDVVRSFRDDRVRLVSMPERGGAQAARNRGIVEAGGRFIALQDSDDIWHPDKLSLQIAAIRSIQPELRVVAVGCDWRLLGEPLPPGDGPLSVRIGTRRQVLGGVVRGASTATLMIDWQRAHPGAAFDSTFPAQQDRDFLLSCLGPEGRVGILDRPLVSVRRGRTDHIASPARAEQGNLRYVQKYAEELSDLPLVRDWYLYSAMREALRAGERRSAARHLAAIRSASQRVRTLPEFVVGAVAGELGLKVATRLRGRPDWSRRVSDQVTVDLPAERFRDLERPVAATDR